MFSPVRSRPWKGSSVSETRDRAAPSHSGVSYLFSRKKKPTKPSEAQRLRPLYFSVDLSDGSAAGATWWRFQEWAVPCLPEHTSSSLWAGGTGRLCTGLQVHSQG